VQLRQEGARTFEVLRLECPPRALHERHERRVLAQGAAHERLDVAACRAVHAGDTHHAAERDRAEPVLDALALHLEERRRKPDVEAARPDPDEQRDGEVTELVQEHEQQ